jgi:hypothetical protein
MNAAQELEEVLTLDQAQELADSDPGAAIGEGLSTQQLLDELLGRFEDDDSAMVLAHGVPPEFYADSDQE